MKIAFLTLLYTIVILAVAVIFMNVSSMNSSKGVVSKTEIVTQEQLVEATSEMNEALNDVKKEHLEQRLMIQEAIIKRGGDIPVEYKRATEKLTLEVTFNHGKEVNKNGNP